jgi:truncated hemoglobin YjbI
MLANLAEVFTAMNTIIEHYDRRMLAWRKKHHKLTPEDRALLAALENPPAEEPPATEEG